MLRDGCARRNPCFVYLLFRPLKLEKEKRDCTVLPLCTSVLLVESTLEENNEVNKNINHVFLARFPAKRLAPL